ncbi:MAG: VWA domain-containing protein [Gammaproteobacteria bacterium]|nr:VWA domain-containing protein [Gammaproteobacteria bacterium]
MLEFSNPWMLLLLPAPLLVYWLAPAYKEKKDSVQVPFFARRVALSGQSPQSGAVILERLFFQKFWLAISWLLIICALTGPVWIGEPIVREKSARDLMIAVDLSGSMDTQDFITSDGTSLNRLEAVKLVLAEFARQRESDRLGLIVFGESPYLQVPFTTNIQTWLTLLTETKVGMAGNKTMFGDAIGLAIKLFENSDSNNRILIVLTDGNDTGSKVPPIEAARVAREKQVKIYTIAVGDPGATGEESLDLEVLRDIAQLTGGGFYQAEDNEQLSYAHADITRLEPEIFETLAYRPRLSLHHYPLSIVLAVYIVFFSLMSLNVWLSNRRLQKVPDHV